MKKILLIYIFIFTSLLSNAQEVTTYYFIRHAEKLRVDKTDRNPNLNLKGFKRAEAWKEVFSNISFDAIYSTDYTRTKLTAPKPQNPTHLKYSFDLHRWLCIQCLNILFVHPLAHIPLQFEGRRQHVVVC